MLPPRCRSTASTSRSSRRRRPACSCPGWASCLGVPSASRPCSSTSTGAARWPSRRPRRRRSKTCRGGGDPVSGGLRHADGAPLLRRGGAAPGRSRRPHPRALDHHPAADPDHTQCPRATPRCGDVDQGGGAVRRRSARAERRELGPRCSGPSRSCRRSTTQGLASEPENQEILPMILLTLDVSCWHRKEPQGEGYWHREGVPKPYRHRAWASLCERTKAIGAIGAIGKGHENPERKLSMAQDTSLFRTLPLCQ